VLFDFDGVLVHGDTFYLFVRDRYARAWWLKLLAVLALPWLLLRLPFSRRAALRTLVHIGLCGLDERRYREAAARFAATLARRPGQFWRRPAPVAPSPGRRRPRAGGDRLRGDAGAHRARRAGAGRGRVDRLDAAAGLVGPAGGPAQRGAAQGGGAGRRRHRVVRDGLHDSSRDIPMLKIAGEPVLVNAVPAVCKRVERALGRPVGRVEWY
jgi:phosphatidylglycerophosphatase C